jgi:hypothetical protein
VTEPPELVHASFILSLCQRFGCLPSQLLDEDAELLQLLWIERLGRPSGGE